MKRRFSESFGIGSSLDVNFRCEDENLNDFIFSKADEDIKIFSAKYTKRFSNMYVDVGLKKLFIKLRGESEYECRINLITDKGSFHATEVGIGASQAIGECLSSLETQIQKKIGKRLTKEAFRKGDPYRAAELEDS